MTLPTLITTVITLEAKTKAGKHRTRTLRHWLCACDVCGEVVYLASKRLDIKCRMTPRCEGRHRKPQQEKEKAA